MASRHPLPYAFAKAHTLLLEDDGQQRVLWAADNTPATALGEALRLHAVTRVDHEDSATLARRISAAYAGGESSAATVVGEVESAVDLGRLMQDDALRDQMAARAVEVRNRYSMERVLGLWDELFAAVCAETGRA